MSDKARRTFKEGVEDFTSSPERLQRLIEQGRCTALVNFHAIDGAEGEPTKLAMISGGFTQREVFDLVCIVRRSMMVMLGYAEVQPYAEAASGDLVADDDPVDPMPAKAPKDQCQGCGRDYWQVLARCQHVGCPKGLYVP